MNNGFMCIKREILDWGWYRDTNTFRVFFHLLMNAQYKDSEFMGRKILRGQILTGRKELAKEINLSEQSVRTALSHLKSTNEISIESTNKFSIITICRFDFWQCLQDEDNQQKIEVSNQQLTSNQPATNQQLTTYNKSNKDNKDNKENNISTEGVVAEASDETKKMINALIEQNEILKKQIEELTKKPKRKKKDPDPAHNDAKNIFIAKYKSLFGEDYYWRAKDAGCMSQLLKQIRFSRKSKGLSDDTEGVLDGLRKFLDYIKDDFVLKHFDVSMLVSQYNSIMTGQHTQRGELTGQVLRRERGEYNEQNFFES